MNPEPHDEQELELPQRPRTRGECVNGPRPCPWVSCRHHLYLDVQSRNGSNGSGHVQINAPGEPWELTESCSLDVAERGEQTLEVVGGLLHITRERIRQNEAKALAHAQQVMRRQQIAEELREAVTGERSRPDLNDASQSTMNVGTISMKEHAKLRAVQPDVTVYRREKGTVKKGNATQKNPLAGLPRSPVAGDIAREVWTNIKTSTEETTNMGHKNPVATEQQQEEARAHTKTLRGMKWTWGQLAARCGMAESTLQNIVSGHSPMSPEHHEKIMHIPLEEGLGKNVHRGGPHKKGANKASKKPDPAGRKPPRTQTAPAVPAPQTAEVTVQWSTALSPALARLDKEIAETEQRLSILRELRAKWAGAEA